MDRIRVGVVFGGRSAEHEVSIQSAKSIHEALDRSRFEPILVGIDKGGAWRIGEAASFILNPSDPKRIGLDTRAPEVLPVEAADRTLALVGRESGATLGTVDVFFPIVHGTYGEDGCLQGLFRLLDVPYVGAGVLGSAVGMDKDVMKRLLQQAGLPIPRFVTVRKHEVSGLDLPALSEAVGGLPVFVKPANLGSSVGITKVKAAADLLAALEEAFRYDSKALVEEAVEGREIECAVLGNEHPEASLCGEVVPSHEFYSYEAKYIDERGARLHYPADLDAGASDRIRGLAVKTFRVLDCAGMGRVDFFLKRDGEVLVNEINTLPGFTSISMYPKLWEVSGLPYPRLLERLIDLAMERHRSERALRRGAFPDAEG